VGVDEFSAVESTDTAEIGSIAAELRFDVHRNRPLLKGRESEQSVCGRSETVKAPAYATLRAWWRLPLAASRSYVSFRRSEAASVLEPPGQFFA